jgi:hypothetical protein
MDRRSFLLGVFAAAGGGAALSTFARAAPAQSLWAELQHLDAAGGAPEDMPAQGEQDVQGRRRARGRYRGRRPYGRPNWRGRRVRPYGRSWAPRRRWGRRRVCRLVRNRRGFLVRHCWRRW